MYTEDMQKRPTKKSELTLDAIENLLNKQEKSLRASITSEMGAVVKEEISYSELRTDIKLDKLKRELDDNAKEYRNDVLNKMDEVMGELAQMREDREVGDYQVGEKIENHEQRIIKLEHSSKTA